MDHDRILNRQIDTIDLFPKVHKLLIDLLTSLEDEEWNKATVLPGRTVKDIASHLLDGSLRVVSICRDQYLPNPPIIKSYNDLINYIQTLNRTWIEVAKRLSPQVLIDLLKMSEKWHYEYLRALNPEDQAPFAVAWAGESKSTNWFNTAREYTEKWHHQMQIRLAVNKSELYAKELFYPVIDTFMRGLPHAYRNVKANNGTGIKIVISGEGGGEWYLEKFSDNWQLVTKLITPPLSIIELPDKIAWRLFADSIDKNEAAKQINMSGDQKLGKPILNMITVLR